MVAAFAGAVAGAAPGLAKTWTPPEGCEIFLTVQSKGCRVTNHYICTSDANGDQWRADFDQEGLFFRSRINAETEWMESFDVDPPSHQVLMDNPKDPASFSELLASGGDSFSFGLRQDFGDGSSQQSWVEGSDRLTGARLTVDGVTLEETEFDFLETDADGNVLRAGRGREYISRDMRLFFAGPGEALVDGQWLQRDASPKSFRFPGEPGFATSRPIFDCDALTAGLQLTPMAPAKGGL